VTGFTYDSGDFANTMDAGLKLADWGGFAQRAAASKKNRQVARPCVIYYIEDAGVVQRAHGAALRSQRHGDHRRRDVLARAVARHDLRSMRV